MKTQPKAPGFRQKGLSLVELMIAMLIGVVLLLGLTQVMSASSAANKLATGVARTQENARFAMDFIQRDVRLAGHMGCVSDQAHMAPMIPLASDATRAGLNLWFLTEDQRNARNYPALSGINAPLRFDLGVQGFDADGTAPGEEYVLADGDPIVGSAADWQPGLPTTLAGLNPVRGSDVLVLRYLSGSGVPARVQATSSTGYTMTPEYGGDTISDNPSGLFGIADCKQVSIFAGVADSTGRVTASATGLNASGMLGDEWSYEGAGNHPMLYGAEVVVYYVGTGAGTGVSGNRQSSLYRARAVTSGGGLAFQREELVEGVESLQLLYGMDENLPDELPRGNITRVRTASGVANTTIPSNADGDLWRRVGTVQVGLLMRSSDPAVAAQADAPLLVGGVRLMRGADDGKQDGYYRSPYESTIAMRNRLFGN